MSELVLAQSMSQRLQHSDNLNHMPIGQFLKELKMSKAIKQTAVQGQTEGVQPTDQHASEKKSAAYNALKSGIYSNALMPWESEAEVEQACQRLCQEFEVQGLAGYVLVRQFVHTTLQTARLERCQAITVANVLNTRSARQEFVEQAGLGNVAVDKIPDWYFSMDPEDHERAAFHRKVVAQARHLRDNHSPDLMLKVQATYPELWGKVMGVGSTSRVYTFGEWITKQYGHSKPMGNLDALLERLSNDYWFDVLWYRNEDRFKAILNSIQAKAEITVTTDPNQQRGTVMLQRKMQSLIGLLADLKKISALEAQLIRPTKMLGQDKQEVLEVANS